MPRLIAPFPFAALPRVDRAAARFTRHVSAALAAAPPLPAALFDARWSALLGGPLRASPGAHRAATRGRLLAGWSLDPAVVAVWNHPSLGAFLAAFPRDLAFLLVSSALGPELWPSPADPWSDAAEGALTALAARAAVTLTAPAPPPTLRAITDHPGDALDALPDAPSLVAWDFTLSGKTVAGVVTLVFDADALRTAPAPDPTARLAGLPVAVRCVGARAELPAAALAALAVGDLLRLDGLRASPAALAGGVTLALGAHPALRLDATLASAARVTVTSPLLAPWSPSMSDSTEVLRELHVDVTVELAAQAVPLATVASWGVGAVVEFPQRIGEAVIVRAGGRPVARGELVDVEGQVGVRVTALL